MPRLLNVNSYHYRRGGSDVVYLAHASLMESLGWDNAFFSMHHPSNLPTPWSRYFIDELEFGGEYSAWQKAVMATKVVYSFEAQRKLRQLLRDHPVDIAHLHCIYHHHSPSILSVLHEANVPTVMTAHDLKIACPAYKMLNDSGICERCRDGSVINVVRQRCIQGSLAASAVVAVESFVHRRLDTYRNYLTKVVVPSRFFLEKFVEWGWPRDRFVYIPNYIDSAEIAPRFDAGRSFLYFGRLAPEKGVATLIRAAARAKVSLVVAGTGPIEATLRELAQRVGGQIEFVGFKTGEALRDLVRSSRAVVLPSEWYENAPMSLLESMAMGKPVIGARIGGIPEMIEDGTTGWSFESRAEDQLAELLAQVDATPDSAIERMGRSARAHVAASFTRSRYVEAMLELYASLGVPTPRREPARVAADVT